MDEKLINLIADLKEKETLALVKEKISGGVDALSLLDDTRKAMEIVGKRFESSDYFLPDLIMAGAIIGEISKIIKPHLEKEKAEKRKGKVVIGTVAGDIHDIGKDIVVFMLDVNGYEVVDLGIDVPVDTFVTKVKEVRPQVVGLSGFLTLAFDSMKKTVEALEKAGLRDSVKVMIGGGQIDDQVCKYARADAYGKDAIAAVTLCRQWIG